MGTLLVLPPPATPSAQPSPPMKKIVVVASIATGVQFGWALQLSLLTPYIQLLGIPRKWAALIWMCGPLSGCLVQPMVGYYSDRSTNRYGRRSPYILVGMTLVVVALFFIGFAADIGYLLGDSLDKGRPRILAIMVFVVGFWVLDISNNLLQAPTRALLNDLAGDDQRLTRLGNSLYSGFMAAGNILGYMASAQGKLHHIFWFAKTSACDKYCANLKSCFFMSATLLFSLTISVLAYVGEEPCNPDKLEFEFEFDRGSNLKANKAFRARRGEKPAGGRIKSFFNAVERFDNATWMLLLVTSLNWLAWFPWVLYDTDWMGREVYGGDSHGTPDEVHLYDHGVRDGALGLMINSIVHLFVSMAIHPLAQIFGVRFLWGGVNALLGFCLVMTSVISDTAALERQRGMATAHGPSPDVRNAALSLFAILGLPVAVTFSIPYELASIYSRESGAGLGLTLGVLNLAIGLPMMVVSLGSVPFSAVLGSGNVAWFIIGSAVAMASAICANTLLPEP